jgi:cation:H+ antiporter
VIMTPVFIWTIVFVISLYVLIRASDYFTGAAAKIGLSFGIPDFIIGVTIVAIGTSLPEIVSSVIAVLRDSSEMVVGNVIGSNIANIFLVLGVAAVIGKKLKITYDLVHIDLPLLMGSAFLLAITIIDGKFTLLEALLCMCGLIVYLLHAVSVEKRRTGVKKQRSPKPGKELRGKTFVVLVLSSFFIFIGAKYTVETVIQLSILLHVGTEVIAASAVALGTSLPELMVTISAARKGMPEIAIGNVLGSNIFNALAVMGIPGLLGILIIPQNILLFGLPMMIIATFLFFFMGQDKEITQWEGWLLIIFYIFFILKLFNIG